jgi:hypothetical protein
MIIVRNHEKNAECPQKAKRIPSTNHQLTNPPPIRQEPPLWLAPVELLPADVIFETGRSATLKICCGPSSPDPTITGLPTDGTPFTTTKSMAGPGARMAGFGGSWLTCRTVLLLVELPVYVEFSWTNRWPMFCKEQAISFASLNVPKRH